MIFLSHSSHDKPIVRRLAQGLEHAGFSVWLDEWQIRVGGCVASSIERGLDTCRFLVVVLSRASVASEWVSREWKAKYWDEVNDRTIRVLPVAAEDCLRPALLRTKRFVNIASDFESGLGELVDSINAYIAEDSACDFYAYALVVARQLRLDADLKDRNEWDAISAIVGRISGEDRFRVQRAYSLHYLRSWHLTVSQLRVELGALGYPTSKHPDFTEDLAVALERFQHDQFLRHVDGVFGPLTYGQMYALHRQSEA